MIIMRALVGTVLLISVVLVSIVVINANTRHVRSNPTVRHTVVEKASDDDRISNPLVEILAEESFEKEDVSEGSIDPKKVSKGKLDKLDENANSGEDGDRIMAPKNVASKMSSKKFESEDPARFVETNLKKKDVESRLPQNTADAVVSGIDEELMFSDGFTVDYKSHENFEKDDLGLSDDLIPLPKAKESSSENIEDKYLEPLTVHGIKARTKDSQTTSRVNVQTTEDLPRESPLGYEPESYIVLDADPNGPVELKLDQDAVDTEDIDPLGSDPSSRSLERKQRAAHGRPETIVLNKVPIVSHVPGEHYHHHHHKPHHQLPLLLPAQSDFQYPAGPPAYNPYNWDHTNVLRHPQCSTCQQKSVPLCQTCGKCSECCHQSGCTCGCLHS